jgi:hypothetical protein
VVRGISLCGALQARTAEHTGIDTRMGRLRCSKACCRHPKRRASGQGEQRRQAAHLLTVPLPPVRTAPAIFLRRSTSMAQAAEVGCAGHLYANGPGLQTRTERAIGQKSLKLHSDQCTTVTTAFKSVEVIRAAGQAVPGRPSISDV